MLITYLKDTGELVPPIATSDSPLTLEDVLGEDKAKIYSQIYDYINIVDNMDIFENFKKYYVDIETKKLKLKPIAVTTSEIQYL